jgi:hypothetical protein
MKKQRKIILKVASSINISLILALTSVQTTFAQWNKANYDMTQLPHNSVFEIVLNIARWILGIFGFIAVIGFIISGILYFTAAGDEDAQSRAKRAMIYSITGVIVGLVGLVVIYAADTLLRAGQF